MEVTRRDFMKVTGAGAATIALSQLGFALAPANAYAKELKIRGATEVLTSCPYCSVICQYIAHVRNGKVVSTEGDADYPVSEGALCAKGAAMLSQINSDARLLKPLYRAPNSDQWEEKDYDWMVKEVARRIKDTRDKYFKEKNAAGQVVNRVDEMFHMGSSQMTNEELSVTRQAVAILGLVNIDHQARVCHSSTVPALAECFGRGAMTNHYIDVKNTDCCLIIGSNAAEHHPMVFRWIMRAKEERGAKIIHVDPKFSRTSARADLHIPLRSGTDIAFVGGMIKYIIDNNKYFKDYVVNYTNAAFIVSNKFKFNDGLFSGYDAKKKLYDKSSWKFEYDANGIPKKDKTLQDPRCVFQMLKKHYSRYDIKKVSEVTGVPAEKLNQVYELYSATGKPDKAGTILYALGWTQHTVGVQYIRTGGIAQLLLGNIGIAGGGVNAMRGEPNVQGATDYAILYDKLPGYHPMPRADLPTLADYNKKFTPISKDPASVNWWQNRPKYVVSMLKAWYGDAATKENDFRYGWLPKLDAATSWDAGDNSFMFHYDKMYKGGIKGGSIFGSNPAQSLPNTTKIRKAMGNLDWVFIADIFHNETTDFWHGPGMNPKDVKTEVFLFPSSHRVEKEGSVSNSGRWIMWHYQATKPRGDSRAMGQTMIDVMNEVKRLYKEKGGTFPEPVVNMDFYDRYDAELIAKKCNGYYVSGPKKGTQVSSFTEFADDGSTASPCWVYAGSFTEQGNQMKNRDLTQNEREAKLGLFPKFSWCWPVNRRILYNRASVDLNGKPWDPSRVVIEWDGSKWIGDVPDGGAPPMSSGKGKYPFIMQTEGFGHLYGPGLVDGPFPEHYEPIETPIKKHLFSNQLNNPCAKVIQSDMDKLAVPGDPRYPIVLTTYSLTEHWCSGSETRNTPPLLEAEPMLYVEMSEELAKEKGIKNGDGVIVESARGRVEAAAMVTMRITPFKIQGKTVHLIGMPFCFGWTTPGCGDATNRLNVSAGDPNTSIPESKACLVNIRKADKVTELY